MNYVTLTISIASFLLASAQWIYTLYCKYEKYQISIENFEWYDYSKYSRCILALSIQNLSNSPLIITKMVIDGVQCHLSHQWIGERYYPHCPETDIPCTERVLSADFPINIVANSGALYKVVFDFYGKAPIPKKLMKIEVQTTTKTKNLTLYRPDKNNQLSF